MVGEVLAEGVAAGGSDDVLVEDGGGAGIGDGGDDAFGSRGGGESGGAEELIVAGGVVAALLVPAREIAEFDFEDGCLEGVEAGVPADFVVVVAAAHAVGAEHAGAFVNVGGEGCDEAGVSEGAEVFGGVEAEGGGVAEGSGGDSVPGGSEGLGCVFDEEEVEAVFEGGKGVPVGALTVEVDGEDGADVVTARGAEELFCGCGGEIVGGGVDVDEEGGGSAAEDGADGGEEAEGGGDDGVAWADSGGGHG